MIIALDIETAPSESDAAIASVRKEIEREIAEISAPANYKDEAKIEAYKSDKAAEIAASFQDRIHKHSFCGGFGKIVCLGFAIDQEDVVTLYGEERDIINGFYQFIMRLGSGEKTFVGHNIQFDLRFIYQRSILLGIEPPQCIPFNARPWDNNIFDTMIQWAGVGNRISLDRLCTLFGIEGKEGMDGSKVWQAYKEGRIDEIAEYCADDVKKTREIAYRMMFR